MRSYDKNSVAEHTLATFSNSSYNISMQKIIALDLEGVLIPEIWKAVAHVTKVAQLGLTTRDINDFNELMDIRIAALKEHSISIDHIQEVIATVKPLDGALDFFMLLRKHYEVILVSDTFIEFFDPLRSVLTFPVVFCNSLSIDAQGMIHNHVLRQQNGKFHLVRNLQESNLFVAAAGDSYNDITMIQQANYGAFFRAPNTIKDEYPSVPAFKHYDSLAKALLECK